MIKPLLIALTLCSSLAYAEGGVVTAGPLTSLDKLESCQSVKNAATPRRSIAIQQWQTSNGTKVLFVAANELPMVDVRVLFNAGSARDGTKYGLASLVSRMLDEGTPTRNTDQIASAFENLGASFNAASYRDMFIVDLRVLSENKYLEPALDVFSDVIAHTSFQEKTFKWTFDVEQIGQQQRQQYNNNNNNNNNNSSIVNDIGNYKSVVNEQQQRSIKVQIRFVYVPKSIKTNNFSML